ncbi:MAG: DUF2079 domain-containing protein [Planctomycetes bacterium]|nr:DUF2079 domain-containing protein [Planctomycetota bacterium]MBM4083597.1 DUF2079 domain-containing protein [Planctomycetota bacterium]
MPSAGFAREALGFCRTPSGARHVALVIVAGLLTGFLWGELAGANYNLLTNTFEHAAEPAWRAFHLAFWPLGFIALWVLTARWAGNGTAKALESQARGFLPFLVLIYRPPAAWLGMGPSFGAVFLLIFLAAAAAGLLTRNLATTAADSWPSERVGRRILMIAAGAFAILFSAFAVRQFQSLFLGYGDTGLFAEALWNTTRGRLLHTNYFDGFTNLLGDHWSPILLALVPLYWLAPRPETLLVLQSVALAAGAFPLYWLAKGVLGSARVALAVALAYLAYPALGHLTTSFTGGFHPESLATPLLLFAFWALQARRHVVFFVCLLLALSCKETVASVVLMLGLFVWVRMGSRPLAVAVVALALVWFFGAIKLAIPYVSGKDYWPLATYYSSFGGTSSGVIASVFGRPFDAVSRCLGRDQLIYLGHMLAPVALLPLLSPSAACVGALSLFLLLVSDSPTLHSVLFHYTAWIIPAVFLAVVYGLKNMATRPSRSVRVRNPLAAGVTALLVATVLSHYFFSPSPLSRAFNPGPLLPNKRAKVVAKLREATPRSATMSASEKVAAHFTDRAGLFVAPLGVGKTDYAILDLEASGENWDIAFRCRNQLLQDERYRACLAMDNFIAFERKPRDVPALLRALRAIPEEKAVQEAQFTRVNGHLEFAARLITKGQGAAECQVHLLWRCIQMTDKDLCPVLTVRDGLGAEARVGPYLILRGAHPTFLWKTGEVFQELVDVETRFDPRQSGTAVRVGLIPRELTPLTASNQGRREGDF